MSRRQISHFRKWLLASPPGEWVLNHLRELLIGALQQGPIPKHVAFVMDGNRRFARNHRIETVEGHNLGFEALARILEVCYKSGVTHVTIYAFSIENFKRSKYEVDGLMEMAKIKLKQLAQHGDLLDRYGAKIRILGQRELIKPDVLEAVDQAVELTSGNGQCILNVCFPYTSREEITTAIRTTVEDYSQPISPPVSEKEKKSPFKVERIANTIRSQHLAEHSKSQQELQYQDTPPPSRPESANLKPINPQSPSSSSTSLSSLSQDQSDHETESISTATTAHHDTYPSSLDISPPSEFTPLNLNSKTNSSTKEPTAASITSSSPIYPSPELITSQTLTEHMYTATDPPIDLLVRTSGVSRLSDFMLWQCHQNTQIVFLDVLWPEFDLWSFLPVLWEWQWRVRTEKKRRMEVEDGRQESVKIA